MTAENYNHKAALVTHEVLSAYIRARQKHAPMHGPHEGYAIILEELDELWSEVKSWQPKPIKYDFVDDVHEAAMARDAYDINMRAMRNEALHVAAMALAFLVEVV
jgi:hypothetical protein